MIRPDMNIHLSCKIIIDNHIQTIEKLYQNSRFEEASIYGKKIYDEMDRGNLKTFSTNIALNIIINDKVDTAQHHKIKTIVKLDNNLTFMSHYDITVILGNLFDNAIKACTELQVQDRVITLFIKTCNNNLCIINMSNPTVSTAKERLIKRSRQGLGLKNIEATVDKYSGSMTVYTSKNNFEVNIQLII